MLKRDKQKEIDNFGRGIKHEVEYKSVWSYSASPIYKKDIQVDILAIAENNDYSLIGEVKNRKAKFSLKEAKEFFNKAQEVIDLEKVANPILFVFSSGGFFKNTLKYLKDKNFVWSEDERFLE